MVEDFMEEQHIPKGLITAYKNKEPVQIKKAQFSKLEPCAGESPEQRLDFLAEVELELEVELGEATITLQEVLQLQEGSIIALQRMAGDVVDLKANQVWLASGEVIVINDFFAIRISSYEKNVKLHSGGQ
ncbi:MAG: FliM/FliN family flagellar motor switch protein [Syntrophomonadaceae bacterium]|jgi:flagellar motor switch protein FliN/FliY